MILIFAYFVLGSTVVCEQMCADMYLRARGSRGDQNKVKPK